MTIASRLTVKEEYRVTFKMLHYVTTDRTIHMVRSIHVSAGAAVVALAAVSVLPASGAQASTVDYGSASSVLAQFGVADRFTDVDGADAARVVPSNTVSFDPGVEEMPTINLTVPAELTPAGMDGGWHQYANEAGSQGMHVLAGPHGGDVLFASSDSDASFEINLGREIVDARQRPEGLIIDLDGPSALAVTADWAVDELGNDLPSELSADGTMLRQQVEAIGSSQVAASFAFTYVYEFDILYQTAFEVRALLMAPNRFDDFFPIPGRPANFPAIDQYLPLYMPTPFGNQQFPCYMNGHNYESWPGSGSIPGGSQFNYSFRAAPGHIEGVGSNISFTFVTQAGATKFFAFGQVMNPTPGGLPADVTRLAAWTQWNQFAININNAPGS